jgi:hypothetical protein
MPRSWRYVINSRCCTASLAGSGSGSSRPIGHGWPRCCTGCPDPACTVCGCWFDPTLCCAGIATCMPAATRRGRGPGGGDGHAPSARSARWCCAWFGRTRLGGTGGCTGNCSPSPVTVAASTVWEILRDAGIDPAPDRAATTWAQFLRSQAEALLAADFLETITLTGTRVYILAVIEHASRTKRRAAFTLALTDVTDRRPLELISISAAPIGRAVVVGLGGQVVDPTDQLHDPGVVEQPVCLQGVLDDRSLAQQFQHPVGGLARSPTKIAGKPASRSPLRSTNRPQIDDVAGAHVLPAVRAVARRFRAVRRSPRPGARSWRNSGRAGYLTGPVPLPQST